MIALKKISIALIYTLFFIPAYSQGNADFGLIVTTSNYSKLAFEYRKPINDRFNFRIAATFGDGGNYRGYGNGQIVSASDSVIVQRDFFQTSTQTGLRFGLERYLGNSMFNIGADLGFDYRQTRSEFRHSVFYLQENGSWSQGPITTMFMPFEDPSNSQISRHYLVSSARLNINMDIPIGNSFLLNLSASGIFGVPIYMGATRIRDVNGDFIGTPPSIFEFDTNLGIGLRYKFGTREKLKK